MRIIVDADSMPARVREIVVKQADRRGVAALFVANRRLPLPRSANVRAEVVDDADARIVELAGNADLVVTHDIPLAAQVADNGAVVITERGQRYTRANVRERLSSRDFAMQMRDAGLLSGQGRPYGKKEVQAFANAIDRELTAGSGREVDIDEENS